MIKNIDGWTDADVKYMWKLPDPVQMADNLLLPGGFELANYTDDRCDIKTSTGMYIVLTYTFIFHLVKNFFMMVQQCAISCSYAWFI